VQSYFIFVIIMKIYNNMSIFPHVGLQAIVVTDIGRSGDNVDEENDDNSVFYGYLVSNNE
jgi:hypothetical protein